MSPLRLLSDDQLSHLHEKSVRVMPRAIVVGLIFGVAAIWSLFAWLMAAAVIVVYAAMFVVCPMTSREMDRRGWIRGEWVPARRFGPWTWHRSVIPELEEDEVTR